MKTYDLTENEMLYLLTTMGAEEPAGREWFDKKTAAEKSLEEKGLVEMDFDGGYHMEADLKAALQGMLSAEQEIDVVSRQPGQDEVKENSIFFGSAGRWSLCGLPERMVRLQPIDTAVLEEVLKVPGPAKKEDLQGKLTTKMDQIAEAYESARANEKNAAEQKINELGASSEMADQIIGVAENKTGIFSVLFKNNTPNAEKVASFIVLIGDHLILMDGEDAEDGSMDVSYTVVSPREAQAKLESAAESAGITLAALTGSEMSFS